MYLSAENHDAVVKVVTLHGGGSVELSKGTINPGEEESVMA